MEKVYTQGDYTQFCESVSTLIMENMADASLGSSIKSIIRENTNPEDVSLVIERLIVIAEDLYNDFMMKRRDKYDFKALLEGINRLNDFAGLQNPTDDVAIPDAGAEVPPVEELPDPMSMVNPNVDGPIETGEHGSLEVLKTAIDAVQGAISSLQSAESQEDSAGELNDGGIAAIPNDEPLAPVGDVGAVDEGLQTLGLPGAEMTAGTDPAGTEPVVPDIQPAGNEGPEHEAEESCALAGLKAGLAQLQAAYADYLGAEGDVHPTTDLGDKLTALSTVSGVDDQTFLEKAKEVLNEMVSEDAQLVNQDWLDKDLANSLAISTKEIAEDAVLGTSQIATEARPGEDKIPTQIIRKPEPKAVAVVDEALSQGALEIEKNVLAALQNAEEMGGVTDTQEYVELLKKIQLGLQNRIDGAAENIATGNPAGNKNLSTGADLVVENPGTPSGEITDQPGEVDANGPIHTDDVNAGFSPENFFKEGDTVSFENKLHIVESSEGRHLTIRNKKTGHKVEVGIEDVESTMTEDIDIRGERFNESNYSLAAEWEKIEKKMTQDNLTAPKRSYDLRTNNPTEGL